MEGARTIRTGGGRIICRIVCLLGLFLMLFSGRNVFAASNPFPPSIKKTNSWKEGTQTCTQFTVKLTNNGSKNVTNWTLKLVMTRNVTMRDNWCASYSVSGATITIKPLSWNKTASPKQTRELGFIVKSAGAVGIQRFDMTPTIGGKAVTYTWAAAKATPTPTPVKKKATPTPTKKPTPTPVKKKATPTPTKKPTPTPVKKATPTPVPKKTPLSTNGRLQVKGGKLVNSSGKSIVLKGVSTHGIAWYPKYVNKSTFQTMRDQWGVQCIRIAMYTKEYGGYLSGGNQASLKKTIDNGVKYATELGMYVIIDWHILSDGNPVSNQSKAVAFFKEMANKYKNYKNVFYEICNEPNGGVSWKQVKSYAQAVIKTIRAIDKNNIILVGTPTWSQDVDVASKDPIKGYSNIMYTFHFYAGTHGESYRKKVQTAISNGLPVFVSEFGITNASGNGGINKTEADKWISFLKKNGISYVCWNISNKNEGCALLKSSCSKLSGFTDSDLSTQGLWFKKK